MNTSAPSHPASRKAHRRRGRGLSLFGVLMALGIASGVVVATVAIYNTTAETQNRNEAQSLLTTLVVAVQQIHQGASDYGTTSTDIVPLLATRNAIPGSARTATNTIVHPFGGPVTVTGSGSTANGRFIVTFEDLEPATCALLLDPFIGQRRAGGSLWQIKVGSRTAVDPPLTAAGINTECSAITGTADVELEFE